MGGRLSFMRPMGRASNTRSPASTGCTIPACPLSSERRMQLHATHSGPELTLITCWPPWSNTYRLVLRAKLVQ